AAGLRIGTEQRFHFQPKRWVARAGPVQVRGAFGWIRQPQGFSEEVVRVMFWEVHAVIHPATLRSTPAPSGPSRAVFPGANHQAMSLRRVFLGHRSAAPDRSIS